MNNEDKPIGRAPEPGRFEMGIVLRDGSTARVRPIHSDDEEALFGFLRALSPSSLAQRFFGSAWEEG